MRFLIYIVSISVLALLSCRTLPEVQDSIISPSDLGLGVLVDTIAAFPEPEIRSPEVTEPEIFVLASIQKTPCFGRCPVYEARIYSDGKVVYHGNRFVTKRGLFQSFLEEGQLQLLIDKANELDFFSLKPEYPEKADRILDFPDTITYFQHEGKELKVYNNHAAPQQLLAFEKFLIQFLDELTWVEIGR